MHMIKAKKAIYIYDVNVRYSNAAYNMQIYIYIAFLSLLHFLNVLWKLH